MTTPVLRDAPAEPDAALAAAGVDPSLRSSLIGLRGVLRGAVLLPGDPGYEDARSGHNTAFDRRPAVVVQPRDADDVAHAVRAAQDLGLELAVKGGGHSVAGHSTIDRGMLVDLSSMRRVIIDPAARIGRAQGGVTAGLFTVAAQEHGLITPFGDTGSVGLGGLTLGGGIGWLVRKHGLTIDSLAGAELVTADGRIRTVDADNDPDLFWAIRGGGGNFGIVTELRFRLHPLGLVTGGALALPLTREVLRGLVDVSETAPEALSQITTIMALPPAPFVPSDAVGTPAVVVLPVHAGDPADGEAVMAPFRALATPIADLLGPIPYPAIYRFTEAAEQPGPSVTRSSFLPAMTEAAIDAILDHYATPAGAMTLTQLRVLGGAMARVPSDATAFAHRDARLLASIVAYVGDSLEVSTAAADAYLADVGGRGARTYVNFVGETDGSRVRDAYPEPTYRRLVEIKRRYDPDNLFRGNQNIRPD
jgi:FAD/FMN-containing dehydrogenase